MSFEVAFSLVFIREVLLCIAHKSFECLLGLFPLLELSRDVCGYAVHHFFSNDRLCWDDSLDLVSWNLSGLDEFCEESFFPSALTAQVKVGFAKCIEHTAEMAVSLHVYDVECWEVLVLIFMVEWEVQLQELDEEVWVIMFRSVLCSKMKEVLSVSLLEFS